MVAVEEPGPGEARPGADGSTLLRVRLAAQQSAGLVGDRVRRRSSRVGRRRRAGAADVARLRGEGPCVIAEGAARQVFAIAPPAGDGSSPTLRWQRPGRGMRDGGRSAGLLAADLDGDGSCEVVVADQARRAGHALLVALWGDGSTLWEKPFPHTGGAPPVWNASA